MTHLGAQRAEAYIAEGEDCFARGDYVDAIAILSKAEYLDDKAIELYRIRGLSHLALGDLKVRVSCVQRQLAPVTTVQAAIINFKHIQVLDTEADGIAEDLCTLIDTQGTLLMQQGLYDIAVDVFSEALTFGRLTAAVYVHRAVALSHLKQWKQAIKDMEYATTIEPEVADYWVLLAKLYWQLKLRDTGASHMMQAGALNPQHPEVLAFVSSQFAEAEAAYNDALRFFLAADYESAVVRLAKSLILFPHNARALLRRATALRELGQFDAALSDINAASRLLYASREHAKVAQRQRKLDQKASKSGGRSGVNTASSSGTGHTDGGDRGSKGIDWPLRSLNHGPQGGSMIGGLDDNLIGILGPLSFVEPPDLTRQRNIVLNAKALKLAGNGNSDDLYMALSLLNEVIESEERLAAWLNNRNAPQDALCMPPPQPSAYEALLVEERHISGPPGSESMVLEAAEPSSARAEHPASRTEEETVNTAHTSRPKSQLSSLSISAAKAVVAHLHDKATTASLAATAQLQILFPHLHIPTPSPANSGDSVGDSAQAFHKAIGVRHIVPPNSINMTAGGAAVVDRRFYVNRGDVLRELDRLHEAMSDYHRAYDVDPTDPGIALRLGMVHDSFGVVQFNEGQCSQAVVDFTAAVTFSPHVASYWIHRGNAYLYQQEPELAFTDYQRAIQLDPDHPEAQLRMQQFMLGKSSLRQEDLREMQAGRVQHLRRSDASITKSSKQAGPRGGRHGGGLNSSASSLGLSKNQSSALVRPDGSSTGSVAVAASSASTTATHSNPSSGRRSAAAGRSRQGDQGLRQSLQVGRRVGVGLGVDVDGRGRRTLVQPHRSRRGGFDDILSRSMTNLPARTSTGDRRTPQLRRGAGVPAGESAFSRTLSDALPSQSINSLPLDTLPPKPRDAHARQRTNGSALAALVYPDARPHKQGHLASSLARIGQRSLSVGQDDR